MVIADDQINGNGSLGVLYPNEPVGRVTQCGLTNWQMSALFNTEVFTWRTCDSATSHSYTNLGLGQQRFHVRLHWPGVAYPNGVVSKADSYLWSVGEPVPAVGMTRQPDAISQINYGWFEFLAYAPDLNLTCQLNDGEWAACNDPESPDNDGGHTAGKIIYQDLANGSHTFRIRGNIQGTHRLLKTFTWNIENVPEQDDIKTFLRIDFDETQVGQNYQALVSIKNQSALSLCLENSTITHCATEQFGQEKLTQLMTPAELDLLWSNNPLIIPRLKQLNNAKTIMINAVELSRVVDESEMGYRTLLNRVSGVEMLRDDEQCSGELQPDQTCQFILSVNISQQPGETDVGYWRRLESYQAPGGLNVSVDAEYYSGNKALFSNPNLTKPPFFQFDQASSSFWTALNPAFTNATTDKCSWAEEEPWNYRIILLSLDGDTFEEAYEAAGCNPEPVLQEHAYFPMITKFPNFGRSGKVFFSNNRESAFSFVYPRNLIDYREASSIPFRWISAEQALQNKDKFLNDNDFGLFSWLFNKFRSSSRQIGYQVVPPSSYQCRVLLNRASNPSSPIVKRSWISCSSGVTYAMPPLSGNLFYTLEVRGVTKDGPSRSVSSVSWTPIDTGKCLLSDARTRFFIYRGNKPKHNAVRMVTRYKASKAGRVTVSYFQRGKNSKRGHYLGTLRAEFSRTNPKKRNGFKFFRMRQIRKPALMKKLRGQRYGFIAKLRVKNAPGYCNTYYETDVSLTSLRRFYGQYVWFQKGSFKKNSWDFLPLTAPARKR
jgi:hypothetical protein